MSKESKDREHPVEKRTSKNYKTQTQQEIPENWEKYEEQDQFITLKDFKVTCQFQGNEWLEKFKKMPCRASERIDRT